MPSRGFPGGSVVKNPPVNAGDAGTIPASGRALGERNGNPLSPVLMPGESHRQRSLVPVFWGELQSMEWQRVGHK